MQINWSETAGYCRTMAAARHVIDHAVWVGQQRRSASSSLQNKQRSGSDEAAA
jgi:hypothetical protein